MLIAVLLNTKGLWFRGVYRALFILPVVIPSIIVATVWRNMFDTDAGAVNFLHPGRRRRRSASRRTPGWMHLNWLRQSDDPIPFIPLPLAYFAMITANTWLGWPLNAVVATGALQSIPGDLYEAAEMDGANAWQKFRTRHGHVPAAGDAAVRDLRLRDHVQPVLPAVLHDRRASRSGGRRSS